MKWESELRQEKRQNWISKWTKKLINQFLTNSSIATNNQLYLIYHFVSYLVWFINMSHTLYNVEHFMFCSHLQPQEERMKSKRRVYSKRHVKPNWKQDFQLSMTHSVWVIASEQRFRTDSFSNHSNEHRTRYRASLVNPIHFHTHAFSKIFIPSPPTHLPAYSFVVQSTSFNCAIVTSYYMSHLKSMPGDPPCHFYVQLVQPTPAKIAKNLQKIQSFKKIFKKPKNPSKNFFSIRLGSN